MNSSLIFTGGIPASCALIMCILSFLFFLFDSLVEQLLEFVSRMPIQGRFKLLRLTPLVGGLAQPLVTHTSLSLYPCAVRRFRSSANFGERSSVLRGNVLLKRETTENVFSLEHVPRGKRIL